MGHTEQPHPVGGAVGYIASILIAGGAGLWWGWWSPPDAPGLGGAKKA